MLASDSADWDHLNFLQIEGTCSALWKRWKSLAFISTKRNGRQKMHVVLLKSTGILLEVERCLSPLPSPRLRLFVVVVVFSVFPVFRHSLGAALVYA